jgi:hypothetical protein
MQTIVCDVCKKKMDDPVTNKNFFYFGKHSICEPCKDSLDMTIRSAIRGKDPYAIDWYDKFVNDSLEKAIQKGKV